LRNLGINGLEKLYIGVYRSLLETVIRNESITDFGLWILKVFITKARNEENTKEKISCF